MAEESVEILTLSPENKIEFIKNLTAVLFQKFEVSDVSDLPENYSNAKPWSLLRMLAEDALDIYQILFVNGQVWGACGGILRADGDRVIYQAGFRTISVSHKFVRKGLGTTPYLNRYCISQQIQRAKDMGCSKVIISFNDHNRRLFDLVQKYHNKKKFKDNDKIMSGFVATDKPVMFNGVPQWLLEMNLN